MSNKVMPEKTEVDFGEMLEVCLEAMTYELGHLLELARIEKLAPTHARDLVGYVKLLGDLEEKQTEMLEGLSDEQLESMSE